MKKEIDKKFCPDHGCEMVLIREDNEKDFFTNPILAMGHTVNRAGNKFDSITGKRLYRTEWHCPIKTKSRFGKNESHLVYLGETDLHD